MTTPFLSDLNDVCVHPTFGWWRMPSGTEITVVPAWDSKIGVMARMGAGNAQKVAWENGWDLATVEQYDELHKFGVHIEPYTLPDSELRAAECQRLGVSHLTQEQEQHFREQNMMTIEWCRIHDVEVWRRLDQLALDGKWDGKTGVDNFGKHWCKRRTDTPAGHSLIYGWFTKNARQYGVHNDYAIQFPASPFHDLAYDDYATTVHFVK